VLILAAPGRPSAVSNVSVYIAGLLNALPMAALSGSPRVWP
jgi:hypothetical protein